MGYIDEPPVVYPEDIWDPEQETVFWEAEPAERQFATGGAWDDQTASPVLAMTVSKTAEGDLTGLSDNELLGAIAANERVAGHHAWVANRLAAEYTKRKLTWDAGLREEVLPEFAEEDYRQEITVSGMTAKGNLKRSLTLDQLPKCMQLAHDGGLDPYRQRIIAEETGVLDPVLLPEADRLIAEDAAGRTPLSLRCYARKIVMMLDPETAEERRKKGSRGRRVEFWSDQSGNVTMAAREMSVAMAAAIMQGLTGWAQIMRKAGIKGSMDNLRHDAVTALLLGRHPVTGTVGPAPAPRPEGKRDPQAEYFNPWGFGDFEPGVGSDEPESPGSPVVNIHLLIPAGTLDPKIDAPGWIPEFGNITGAVARELIRSGTTNPATRWCVTEVDPRTGYAVAHGCARGQHRWPAADTGPPGTGPPGQGIREFLASLKLTMERIAQGPADDEHREPQHDPSRKLRHLIEARHATCATPGCDTPAVTSDMEHRIEYENGGPTSESNLDPGGRHCHRVKQQSDWKVIKTGPAETTWIGASGRPRTVRPTRYLI